MADSPVYPVRALGEHARALEAAMSVCLREAKPERVHELRRSCNRIEADLELLQALSNAPPHKVEAQEVHRRIKRLRRTAGAVRDFDVQRKLLKEHFVLEGAEPPVDATLAQESKQLRRVCKRGRKKAAKKLHRVLRKNQADVSSALEALSKVLQAAIDLAMASKLLRHAVEGALRYAPRTEPAHITAERLHELRKVAKGSRYKAELGAASPRTARRAEDLKQLQDAGGDWHDWFQLTKLARRELGKKKPATLEFSRREAIHRQRYRELLTATWAVERSVGQTSQLRSRKA